MQDIEKLGLFYLGKVYDSHTKKVLDEPVLYEAKDLTTHAVCLGMTGSGKTGLGMSLLEEAAIDHIPAIIIDPKGDLGNLLLTFPDLQSKDFLPWIDQDEAARKGQTIETYSENIAKTWEKGLKDWGEDGARIKRLKDSVDVTIYTPASQAGIPLSILNSFSTPSSELMADPDALRDRIMSTTSSLLGLLGIEADPIKSREHILISTILNQAWSQNRHLELSDIIQEIQNPSIDKIGVFDIDTFYPPKERLALSMKLNNLLASPGFQAWMTGEPLDIQRLLYTKEGKPRHSIISIAHLSDSERMFFLTLLLNELISWMRRQSGTSSLRAIFYMDEVFGFFPPTATPPSKLPMLTLLKQARAFGLGIVLATQNPVDLDYKGLSNCGTWFIGKLQTARDKSRVLEGLKTAINLESGQNIDQLIDACGNRVFIMRSVHQLEPILFQTRWLLSYLRGPLTLPQIQLLMETKKKSLTDQDKTFANQPLEPTSLKKDKPIGPSGVLEYFVEQQNSEEQTIYHPQLLAKAKLHFTDAKSKIDLWQTNLYIFPLSEDKKSIAWDKGTKIPDTKTSLFSQKNPPVEGSYDELPFILSQSKNYSSMQKDFLDYLYQNLTFDTFQCPDLKLMSKEGESEGDFQSRVTLALREKRDEEIRKLRDRYATKMNALTDKIKKAQDKVEKQKSDQGRQKLETYVSIGSTLLGSLFGRGVSKGTISQAGSSLKKVGKIGKEGQEVAQTEESLTSYQQQLQELQSKIEAEVAGLVSSIDISKVNIEKNKIRPKKSDMTLDELAIVWLPFN